MIAALTQGFGSFDAWCTGRDQPLNWTVDFWSDGKLSLISNQDAGNWAARTGSDTPECLSIVLPHSGALNMSIGRTVVEGTSGKLLLMNNHDVGHVSVSAASHRSDTLVLNWAIMAQTVAAILDTPLIGAMELVPVLDLSNATGQLICSLLRTIIVGMRNNGPLLYSPIAMSNLTQALCDLIVRSVPHRLSHLLDRKVHLIAPRHVHLAIDFMHANIDQPISTAAIAEAAGVSVRTLENGFRVFREMTPGAYLRSIRLKATRKDLLDPFNNQSVKDICLKWGFFHFGRFSLVYRAAYGERPSETRKRLQTI
ncbi:AraC family transcriptional regulator [Agrobacterium pusense]|uniref:AraC family transcriptional regulator n=1 Tax=Agrobacterium pusense TaxID=648995 RepID=UPI003FD540EC